MSELKIALIRAPNGMPLPKGTVFIRSSAAAYVQFADGPLRARGHHLEYLLGLDAASSIPDYGGQAIVAEFIATFKEFPPRQRPQSFTVDQIMEKLQQP